MLKHIGVCLNLNQIENIKWTRAYVHTRTFRVAESRILRDFHVVIHKSSYRWGTE